MPRTRVRRGFPRWALAFSLSLVALGGCAAARTSSAPQVAYAAETSAGNANSEAAPSIPPFAVLVGSEATTFDVNPSGSAESNPGAMVARSVTTMADVASYRSEPEALAAVSPTPPPPDRAPDLPDDSRQVATDAAPAGPIVVYTASFLLSVYEVEKAQLALKDATQKLGGFIAAQTETQITLRVPAARFEQALSTIESTGKVRARNVHAIEVGEQYRDLNIRLSTAEAMRKRLEALLARSEKVEEALTVEKELERVVQQIEQLKGQLRALTDRIAFSTLIVEFRPESRPDLDEEAVFRLPYPWLDQLGLHHLLELAP
jgi:hypothetical protein